MQDKDSCQNPVVVDEKWLFFIIFFVMKDKDSCQNPARGEKDQNCC